MVTIFIENVPYEVPEGRNLLQACLSLGFDIPYFCWHPALHSVGACRVCAVKQFRDEKDARGKIVMSCMTPAAEGTRISIEDEEARRFRAGVVEWLMANHPHDCPVCDEGGECHLQDMTVMTGHVYRRFRFRKRTHRNQHLGPFLNHEMNRCIQCYRCVRFYRDYAGGRDLDVFGAHDHVYFGRHEGGVLESEFSGNLAEVCPTGVFTDKTLKRHYTRKWDLETAPSVCVHCGLGCNTIVGGRQGSVRRVLNRYHEAVNGYFLCDRGRFGYEFVNGGRRIRQAIMRTARNPAAGETGVVDLSAGKEQVLRHLGEILHFGARVIGIGSPRASLEANFALRSLVGPENFHAGVSDREHAVLSEIIRTLKAGPALSPSLKEVRSADAVLVLGEDVTNTAPLLALAVRQSVRRKAVETAARHHIPEWNDGAVRIASQDARGPLFIAATGGTKLDDMATATFRAAPEDLARLGFAVARRLSGYAAPVEGLDDSARSFADAIAGALAGADRPVVISGMGCGTTAVVHAAADIAAALCEKGRKAGLLLAVPECNTLGLGLMGGASLGEAFAGTAEGRVEAAIILQNDLYRRAGAGEVDAFLSSLKSVIAIDHLHTATTDKADVILPCGTFAEDAGTFVNSEGRAQRFFRVLPDGHDVQEGWRWIRDMMRAGRRPEAGDWRTLDDVTGALARAIPLFGPAVGAAPPQVFRLGGMKVPRQPHRASGRTAIAANVTVHEPKPPDDPDSPLSFSMEGCGGEPPSPLINRYWVARWNSVQALNRYQREVGGPLHGGDPGSRLIEPPGSGAATYVGAVPAAFAPLDSEMLFVPLHHIFGSEELSALAPAIAELTPSPCVAMNSKDARAFGAADGETVTVVLGEVVLRYQVKIDSRLPRAVAGLPVGLPGTTWVDLPARGRVAREGGGT